MRQSAILALEDGTLFYGESVGVSKGFSVGEVVFNTAMTGYQEVLTDPSYAQQLVTLTYPHIGNTGFNEEDNESDKVHAAGLIIRDLPELSSNWRSQGSLDDFLQTHNTLAIAGIDTRKLTRILRKKGAQKGCLMAGDIDPKQAVLHAQNFSGLKGKDLAQTVTTSSPFQWLEGRCVAAPHEHLNAIMEQQGSAEVFKVVAYDFGVKRNILRLLVDSGCEVTVVPAQTPAETVLAMSPDGIFLSNGPGDPEPCEYALQAIKIFLAKKIPLFGICLGHQLLSLASGAKTLKMKFGHHGANHPVQDLDTKKVLITSQNHGFSVDESSLPECLRPTYRSLFDGSLQGIERTDVPAFSFQGHPEASPGPVDIDGLFAKFTQLMQQHKH